MADLKRPEQYPGYAQAYRAFRDLFNYDARQISLMAWNGSNGIFAGQPGYVSYTSWRNTPAEEAMRDHLVSHADLPLGSRLWTFGSAQHADDDGWTAEGGSLTTQRSRLVVAPDGRRVVLTSPPDQVIRMRNAASAVVGVDPARVQRIEIWLEAAPGSGWVRMGAADAAFKRHAAGLEVMLQWPRTLRNDAIAERMRIELTLTEAIAPLTIERVALIGDVRPARPILHTAR